MKIKSKSFAMLLTLAAALSFTACSDDSLVGEGGGSASGEVGDLYLSMNLRPATAPGSRTSTPNQGSEIGKDYENKVSSALIIFASKDTQGNDVVFYQTQVGEVDFKTTNTDYTATFAVDRKTILEDIGDAEEKSYSIFVIANPTYDIVRQYGVGAKIQQTISLNTDVETYWTRNHFLMSNADKDCNKTITKAEIAPGKCTKEDEAYNLGTVKIQRAMSRLDFNKTNVTFTIGENRNEDYQVGLVFDGMALINQATSQYLFKVTGEKETDSYGVATADVTKEYNDFMANPCIKFGTETYHNFVFSPVQDGFTLPLFGTGDGYYNTKGATANGVLSAKTYDFTKLSYTTFDQLKDEDNEFSFEDNTTDENKYYIWRYCMENTIFGKDAQVHGSSTGIVFRAKLTGKMIDGANKGAVYAYNNVILGNAAQLKAYATGTEPANDAGIYEVVKILYHDVIENYKKDNEGAEPADLAALDKYLVANNFTVYRPDAEGNYYCYYTYWNRHNDNLQNTIMWPMEFAAVRNNVYKISLNTVVRLGHPNTPDDDPDPEDPDTPDEKDSFYCTVLCKVLPWEVRINHVDL